MSLGESIGEYKVNKEFVGPDEDASILECSPAWIERYLNWSFEWLAIIAEKTYREAGRVQASSIGNHSMPA
jgi:hypothetical protein